MGEEAREGGGLSLATEDVAGVRPTTRVVPTTMRCGTAVFAPQRLTARPVLRVNAALAWQRPAAVDSLWTTTHPAAPSDEAVVVPDTCSQRRCVVGLMS